MLFINLSQIKQNPDPQSRRMIRAEAMRDYQRRQRELKLAKQRKILHRERRVDIQNPPVDIPGRASRPEQIQPRADQANGNSLADFPSLRQSPSEPTPLYTSKEPLYASPSGNRSSPKLSDPSRGIDGWGRLCTQNASVDHPVGHHSTQATLSVMQKAIPRKLVVWQSGSEELFNSPSQIAQLISLFTHYMRWLLPSEAHILGERNMMTYHDECDGPSVCASVLCRIGCLESLSPSLFHAEAMLFKMHALNRVNILLADPKTATSDKTLRMLTNLVVHEICRGHDEVVRIHLGGVSRILELRHEYPLNIKQTGDLKRLTLIDLVHAASLDRSPTLTALFSPLKPSRKKYQGKCWTFSPLLPFDDPFPPPSELLPMSQATWSSLRKAWIATRNIFDGIPGSCASNRLCRTKQHRGYATGHRNSASIDIGTRTDAGTEDSTLAEACRLASAIHLKVANSHNKIRYRDPINEADAKALHRCLSSRTPSSWIELREVAPFLYLWILMTAYAGATTDRTRTSWLFSQILRTSFRAFAEDDSTELLCLNNFHWLQKLKRSEPPPVMVLGEDDNDVVTSESKPDDTASAAATVEETVSPSIAINRYINTYILGFARAHCDPRPGLPMLLHAD